MDLTLTQLRQWVTLTLGLYPVVEYYKCNQDCPRLRRCNRYIDCSKYAWNVSSVGVYMYVSTRACVRARAATLTRARTPQASGDWDVRTFDGEVSGTTLRNIRPHRQWRHLVFLYCARASHVCVCAIHQIMYHCAYYCSGSLLRFYGRCWF